MGISPCPGMYKQYKRLLLLKTKLELTDTQHGQGTPPELASKDAIKHKCAVVGNRLHKPDCRKIRPVLTKRVDNTQTKENVETQVKSNKPHLGHCEQKENLQRDEEDQFLHIDHKEELQNLFDKKEHFRLKKKYEKLLSNSVLTGGHCLHCLQPFPGLRNTTGTPFKCTFHPGYKVKQGRTIFWNCCRKVTDQDMDTKDDHQLHGCATNSLHIWRRRKKASRNSMYDADYLRKKRTREKGTTFKIKRLTKEESSCPSEETVEVEEGVGNNRLETGEGKVKKGGESTREDTGKLSKDERLARRRERALSRKKRGRIRKKKGR